MVEIRKGLAIETVLFAVILVIVLIIFILFYKRLIPGTTDLVSRLINGMKDAFCSALGWKGWLLPICH